MLALPQLQAAALHTATMAPCAGSLVGWHNTALSFLNLVVQWYLSGCEMHVLPRLAGKLIFWKILKSPIYCCWAVRPPLHAVVVPLQILPTFQQSLLLHHTYQIYCSAEQTPGVDFLSLDLSSSPYLHHQIFFSVKIAWAVIFLLASVRG